MNDVVHIGKDTILSFPCLPIDGEEEKKPEEDHLQEHGSPLCGLGLNDIVHVDKDTVVSIPCVPALDHPKQD